jgi:hypothetical protein
MFNTELLNHDCLHMGSSQSSPAPFKGSCFSDVLLHVGRDASCHFSDSGNKLYAERRFDEAIEAYSRGLALETLNAQLYSNRSPRVLLINAISPCLPLSTFPARPGPAASAPRQEM